MKYILFVCVLVSCGACYGQYPTPHYDPQLTVGANAYIETQFLYRKIDSLTHEVQNLQKLLEFNTDMGNYYFRRVDSLIKELRLNIRPGHGIDEAGIFIPDNASVKPDTTR